MSSRNKNESHSETHRRAAELHDNAAHAHRVAEQHGKQDHLTGHEQSRQALEHSRKAHEHTQGVAQLHGVTSFGHLDIANLAHALWQARGYPDGSPQEDWFKAEEQLRAGTDTR